MDVQQNCLVSDVTGPHRWRLSLLATAHVGGWERPRFCARLCILMAFCATIHSLNQNCFHTECGTRFCSIWLKQPLRFPRLCFQNATLFFSLLLDSSRNKATSKKKNYTRLKRKSELFLLIGWTFIPDPTISYGEKRVQSWEVCTRTVPSASLTRLRATSKLKKWAWIYSSQTFLDSKDRSFA